MWVPGNTAFPGICSWAEEMREEVPDMDVRPAQVTRHISSTGSSIV